MKFNQVLIVSLLAFSASIVQSCVSDATAKPKAAVVVETKEKTVLSITEAVELAKKDNKKIVVDIYTDWCKWCKVMDQQTFNDPDFKSFLDEGYHFVKLNAEHKSAIDFNGKTYNWVKGGRSGYNQLAHEMLDGRMAYPSMVVFDSDLNKLQVIRGFKKADELKALL